MADDLRPVVVAFDGSSAAHGALHAAAELFATRTLIVVSVWEPGVARAMQTMPDASGFTYQVPDPETVATVDRLEEDHASAVARAGVELARGLGCTAEAVAIADESDIAETVCAIAEQRDAAAIVVGSRGLGGVRAKLLGSVSKRLLRDTHRPVVVVRERR